MKYVVTLLVAAVFSFTSAPAQSPTVPSAQESLLVAINAERAKLNLPALKADPKLQAAAQRQAEYQAITQRCTHLGNGGLTARVRAAGFTTYRGLGEIVAAGYSTPLSVLEGWKHSRGHWNQIIDRRHTLVGVGFRNGYWAVVFATP